MILHRKNKLLSENNNKAIIIFRGFQANPAGKYVLVVKGTGNPNLYLVGPYKISGRVLILPIQGEGISNITLGNGLNIKSY